MSARGPYWEKIAKVQHRELYKGFGHSYAERRNGRNVGICLTWNGHGDNLGPSHDAPFVWSQLLILGLVLIGRKKVSDLQPCLSSCPYNGACGRDQPQNEGDDERQGMLVGGSCYILGVSTIGFLMSVAFLIASLFVGPKTEREEADE